MGRKSRDKGKVGERELSHELTRLFGVECSRSVQYCGSNGDSDVVGLPGVHCECKRTEKLSLYPAVQQAVDDSNGGVPVVFHRANNKPWLAIVRLEDLPQLAVSLYLQLASSGGTVREIELSAELNTARAKQ